MFYIFHNKSDLVYKLIDQRFEMLEERTINEVPRCAIHQVHEERERAQNRRACER